MVLHLRDTHNDSKGSSDSEFAQAESQISYLVCFTLLQPLVKPLVSGLFSYLYDWIIIIAADALIAQKMFAYNDVHLKPYSGGRKHLHNKPSW